MGASRGDSRVRKVTILVDTNMLLLAASGINIFEQIENKLLVKPEFIVLKPVVNELEKLSLNEKISISKKAKLALELVRKFCRVVDVELGYTSIDDLILEYADRNKLAVATCDRELRRKLRSRGIPEIYLREEKMMIEIEGLEI